MRTDGFLHPTQNKHTSYYLNVSKTLLHNITKHLHFWVSFILIPFQWQCCRMWWCSLGDLFQHHCCLRHALLLAAQGGTILTAADGRGPGHGFSPKQRSGGPEATSHPMAIHAPYLVKIERSIRPNHGVYMQEKSWMTFYQGSAKLKDKLSNCVTTLLGKGHHDKKTRYRIPVQEIIA